MKWISVKDRLPDNEAYVLAVIPYKFMVDTMLEIGGSTIITLLYFDGSDGKYWFNDQTGEEPDYKTITHWMPLPEPPEDL